MQYNQLIDQLNQNFAINNILRVTEGRGGLPVIQVSSSLVKAEISLHGGQVLSFIPLQHQQDLLFVSDKAYFQPDKAIKGGTPICWPWFGAHTDNPDLPAHGFVRSQIWALTSADYDASGQLVITLQLEDTEQTRKLWPYKFRLIQRIGLGELLTIDLSTFNSGNEPFEITQAIHTYFKVGDIRQVEIHGLENATYLDKVDGFTKKTQSGLLKISNETDRIYIDIHYPLAIRDTSLDRKIQVQSSGSHTAVIWNPWSEICRTSKDLDDMAYIGFVCVESANAANEIITLNPGESSKLTAQYVIYSGA